MLIANPIYDVVFKYLMEDERVARLIISTIIGEEIEELTFTPRERTAHIPSLGVTVFRLDFSAVIRMEDGAHRNVLIELQKADGGDDVRRFRRYLAENYYEQKGDVEHTTLNREALPIISIYLLGRPLRELKGYSVVKVKRHYYDAVTGEQITDRSHFVECLTHDSFVIQLSELKQRRRNRLEQLLSLFEQLNLQANRHLKEFTDTLPDEFEIALKRLLHAALDRKMQDEMEVEDDVLSAWKKKEREFEEKVKAATAQAEEAKAREEEAKAREEIVRQQAIQVLVANGMNEEDAKAALGIGRER